MIYCIAWLRKPTLLSLSASLSGGLNKNWNRRQPLVASPALWNKGQSFERLKIVERTNYYIKMIRTVSVYTNDKLNDEHQSNEKSKKKRRILIDRVEVFQPEKSLRSLRQIEKFISLNVYKAVRHARSRLLIIFLGGKIIFLRSPRN